MRYNIGRNRIDQKVKNMNSIFDALYRLGGRAKLDAIKGYMKRQLEMQNADKIRELEAKYHKGDLLKTQMDKEIKKLFHPLSSKTIQRCTNYDPRIDWDGTFYSISEKTRLELRNFEPEMSGLEIFREVMNRYLPENLQERILDFIQRLGAFTFFTFIEASRPINDGSLTIREREYLVEYWAEHALPIEDMFTFFRALFENGTRERKPWAESILELSEKNIDELLGGMREALPVIYSDIMKGRQLAFSRKESVSSQ